MTVQPDVILVRKRLPVVPVANMLLIVATINGVAPIGLLNVVMDNIVVHRC